MSDQCSEGQGISPEADLEYGRTVIELAGEDVRQVYLRVTGILGIAVLFLTQLPFGRLAALSAGTRWLFIAGLVAAAASGAAYFRYLSNMHLARLEMASWIREGKAAEVGTIWSGQGTFWTKNKWLFRAGTWSAVASLLLLGVTLVTLLGLR